MLSDHQDLAEALFRVERPGDEVDRGPSPAEEVLEAGQLDTASLEQEEAVHQERRVSVLSLRLGSLALAQIAGPAESSLLVEAGTLDTNLAVQQEYSQFQFRSPVLFQHCSAHYLCLDLGSPVRCGRSGARGRGGQGRV